MTRTKGPANTGPSVRANPGTQDTGGSMYEQNKYAENRPTIRLRDPV